MKILFVTSEAAPFITSGGLGEVMSILPKAIRETEEGTECEVILPLYSAIKDEYKQKMQKVCDITFDLSWRKTGASIYKLCIKSINYYFVENKYYCNRPEIYGEYDDGERFAFFSTAVIEFMINTGNVPDVLHANDWQTALTVIYLKTKYADTELFKNTKIVYTIHNIEFQGKYDSSILNDVFGLDNKYLPIVEYNGMINLMKGGIISADIVTTVSETYAKELEHDYYAFGLAEIVKMCRSKIHVIINGIDYSYYSPDTGGDIYFPYTKRGYKSGKANNKKQIQIDLGLEVSKEKPLAVMITRLAKQKGIDLFIHIAEELLREKIQIVVLGTGEREFEEKLSKLNQYNNFKSLITFDRALAKKLYAAADMFIMPSLYEPCGLSQMIAMSYGAVPIARNVGGLYDTIVPYGEKEVNGFLFNNYNAHELLFALKLALAVYNDKEEWNKIVKNALKSNFSWDISAHKYIQLYKNAVFSEGKNDR